ncbi:MAG: patatin-like phospholipase family protein [Nitrososphaeraceae archaeon]|nr:patatin-like phospholipase family protein [Nitrososphaeraceae archaeon]
MSKVVRQIKEEAGQNLPKDTKRAVIFQGGGAIGAYAAGVYAALYYWMKKDITDAENIFDIVAGASAGAINASIIVGHVMASKSKKIQRWEGSVKKLLDFWSFISSSPNFTKWKPFFSYFWPFFGNEKDWITVWDNANFGNIASGEAARRYYSSKEYLYSGAPNVFSYQINEIDDRFFDNIWPVTNDWYRYDNNALKVSIQGYTDFPIKTSPKAADPRLLIVAVDVEEGEQVTFDSHSDNVGFGYTEKGEKKYSIEYRKGLMVEHIMASSSVPVHYDYALVPVKYDYTKPGGESEPKSESIDFENGEYRRFWDGGILSNTPLREVIQAHQDLKEGNIPPPSLKVYIVDVWPSVKHYPIASDHDGVINRKNDLIYQDKTFYEEKVTHLISDYKSLVEKFRNLAKENNLQIQIDDILSDNTPRSRKRDGSTRTYGELIETVFDIDITRIERTANENEISFKWCDYSVQTIDNLINQGIKDTVNVMIEQSLQRHNQKKGKAEDEIEAFKNSVEDEKQIQQLDERYAILLTDVADSIL